MHFERRNHGTGHTYWLDGRKLPGVTTIIGEALRAHGLESWNATATAQAAINRWDELARLPIAQRYDTLVKARYAQRDTAALRGTRIHALAEQLVAGTPVEVPEEHQGPVQALARFLDLWHVMPVLTEVPVFHVEHGWAGTPDLVATIHGTRWLIDWKTGSGIYPDAALQLSAYAHATHWQDSNGTILDWVPPERAGAVHITPDSAELRPLDAGDDTYLVFRHMIPIARWADRASDAYKTRTPWPVGAALTPAANGTLP